jgi:hypothetical protein
MSIVMQINPFEFFADTQGDPLDAGYIWIGQPNVDPRQYPVSVFYDADLTIPAAMPLRTRNGYVVRNGSPTFLYVDGNYSVRVEDSRNRQVFYVPDFLMVGSGSAVSSGDLANQTDPAKGSGIVGYIRDYFGATGRTAQSKMSDVVSGRDFGLIGDGSYHPLSERYSTLAEAQAIYPFATSLTQSIDWAAIQSALNYAVIHPCKIDLHDCICITTDTLVWKGGAFLIGVDGRCSLKLHAGANCTVLDSDQFDFWAAWTSGSNAGYTLDGGIDGIIIDGNAAEQGDVSTVLGNLVYGMRIHSHRFSVGWLQVRRVKGVGLLFQYNQALMNSYRSDGIDDYGFFGDPRGTPSPYDFRRINVIDCLFEAFIFKGPADIPIWHLTTNYCGWLDPSTLPTTPRTSLLFPGQEIHSVRIEAVCMVGYLNANAAFFGRSLYIAPNVRFHGGTIIESSSWGGVLIDASAYGAISHLVLQQNAFSYGGVYKPYLECVTGSGSGARKGRFSFPQITPRRISGGSPNNIGPMIYDDAGHQFGIIDALDSFDVPGHGLVLGANSIGGIYESVNFDSLTGLASDGTASAAVMIEDGARDWRIGNLRITDCDRGIVNKGVNMRGIVENATIEVNTGVVTGQIALEGIVALSQLASVIPGTGNIAADNISDWDLEILDNSVRYYNKFKTTSTFNTAATGQIVNAAIDHKMWRQPTILNCTTGIQWGGSVWPNFIGGVRTPTASQVIPAGYVHTASVGTLTMSININ